jgi:chaperonin cofactor prefoldin
LFVDEDVKELIGGLAEEMRRGFAKVDARFEKMDARFEEMDGRFEKMDAKIDERFEEAKRHFGVLAEELRSNGQAIAERIDVVDRKIDRVDERLSGELAEIKAMIPISFTQLDGRIRSLETDNADLQSRVERLESTAH